MHALPDESCLTIEDDATSPNYFLDTKIHSRYATKDLDIRDNQSLETKLEIVHMDLRPCRLTKSNREVTIF